MIRVALAAILFATPVHAGDLRVENALIPLAPPGATVHSAYLTLTNDGDAHLQLVGVAADGYMMAHIHMTEVNNDVATMSAVDLVEIAPGQSVSFEQAGLHIMLMRPMSTIREGDVVSLTFEFADGTSEEANAMVMRMMRGSHGS